MEIANAIEVDRERVKERIDSYITNRGYIRERTFSPNRLEIYFVDKLSRRNNGFISSPMWTAVLPTAPAHNFWENMRVLMELKELFKPVGRIYQEGKQLYSEASVLTPKYSELYEEKQQAIQNLRKIRQYYIQEIEEIEKMPQGIKRWFLSRKPKQAKKFYDGFLSHDYSGLPKIVPSDVSLSALSRLYDWLQIREKDFDSKEARVKLAHPPDPFTREQGLLLGVREDLYKIKNHTAIVCLDQLKRDGLTLDAVVSQEIDKIPREHLRDVYYCNENVSAPFRLRTGDFNSFGAGLFN